MIASLCILGKFLDPQILPGERSGTFRDSGGGSVVLHLGEKGGTRGGLREDSLGTGQVRGGWWKSKTTLRVNQKCSPDLFKTFHI